MQHVPRETSQTDRLDAALRRLLPQIDSTVCAVFKKHYEILCLWNSTHNLTRITVPEDAALLHYVDSLLPLRSLPPPTSVVDIGSGTGLPGIAAAALWPSVPVTLVDSSAKKSSFLRAVRAQIQNIRVEVVQGRCESIPAQQVDLALIRATFNWPEIPGQVARHLATNGRLLAYLGQEAPSNQQWAAVVEKANLGQPDLCKYLLPDHSHIRHAAFATKE